MQFRIKTLVGLISLALISVSCKNSDSSNPVQDRKHVMDQKHKALVQHGCLIDIVYNDYKVDCQGLPRTCEATANALKTLNEYRAALYDGRHQDSFDSREKALAQGISVAVNEVHVIRDRIHPSCTN